MSANSDFFSKLHSAIDRNNSLLCVGLDPHPAQIPARFRTTDNDPIKSILAWNRALIEATAPYVAIYKPNIAFYEALGLPGAQLLHDTLAAIPADIPVLLDAKRGDMGNTAQAYAKAIFDVWQVDAVTLNPYMGKDSVEPYFAYPGKGLFLVCHTSNPGSTDFQELEITDWGTLDREPNLPLYIRIARTTTKWSNQIGLVVGATYPAAIAATRAAAPDAWFLIPGIGAQGGDLEGSVTAGIRADKQGILVSASRSLAQSDDPTAAAKTMRDAINEARTSKTFAVPSATSPLTPQDEKLIDGLIDLAAVKFGDFTLASGKRSPIYIDLRLLVSNPTLLALAADAYSALVAKLTADRVCGVPYAALPIATAVSLRTELPMIYTRKEVKTHGLGKDVEGNWQEGERIVIIEDLITSGGSIIKSVDRLRELGMVVEDTVVLIDRGQGGIEKLAAAGIRAHAVFSLPTMLDYLVAKGRMDEATANSVRLFIKENQL